ncbi:hypothetical protein BJY52DRAFT_1352072 [Lactarius psammicola]|nr:hypothetical protein BJY52DRAFT_1352072 [Lactarius psammicola]
MSRKRSPQVGEARSLDGGLVHLSRAHFSRVVTTTIKTIIHRLHHEDRNAQRALMYHDKPRKRKGKEPHAIAQTLPDDVLLKIFDYHRLASLRSGPWKWHRLAQVCRRWRFVIFAYPHRLDLRIVSTYNKPIWEAPDFWPALPIIIWYPQSALHGSLSAGDEDSISDILKNPAHICEMHIDLTRSLFEKCTSLIEESRKYLQLRTLNIRTTERLVLPGDFLGGSIPQLRVIHLDDTAFPTLPRLLSYSKNLVSLRLEKIPSEGYFAAEDLAIGLSAATQLESLKLDFHNSVFTPLPPRLDDLPPSPTRIVLPALVEFEYRGQSTYLDDFASRIDAPIIEKIGVTFFCDFEYDTYELCEFFGRGEELRSSRHRTTYIRFFEGAVAFTHHFSRSPSSSSPGSFRLRLPYRNWLYEHVGFVNQICLGFKSRGTLHKVTRLEIEGFPDPSRWHTEMDPASWLTLLRTLTGVKRLHIVGTLVSSVVSALVQVTEETIHEVLPALRDLHLQGTPGTSASTSASVEPFITARKLYGLPVSVHYKGLDWHDNCSSE